MQPDKRNPATLPGAGGASADRSSVQPNAAGNKPNPYATQPTTGSGLTPPRPRAFRAVLGFYAPVRPGGAR